MHLAEFPLCALAHRLRPDQKTLRFENRVWDDRRKETITRQLTITGSDVRTAAGSVTCPALRQSNKVRSWRVTGSRIPTRSRAITFSCALGMRTVLRRRFAEPNARPRINSNRMAIAP